MLVTSSERKDGSIWLVFRPPVRRARAVRLHDRRPEVIREGPMDRCAAVHLRDRVAVHPDVFVEDVGRRGGSQLRFRQKIQLRGVEIETLLRRGRERRSRSGAAAGCDQAFRIGDHGFNRTVAGLPNTAGSDPCYVL